MKEPQQPKFENESAKERRERLIENTTLIIPQNDGESIMIGEIADHFGIDVRRVSGSWNSSTEERKKQLRALKNFKQHVVAVELAVPDIEEEWGQELEDEGSFTWIDHHSYPGGLVRLKEGAGCSLDQFLEFFGIDDEQLLEAKADGFPHDPRFVRGVAINDDAFIKGMIKKGYSLDEIKNIREFDRNGQYGDETREIHQKNQDFFDAREVVGIISIMDFGNDQVNYTYAKDLAIFEKLEEIDGKVIQHPVITFIIRPSFREDGKFDVAIDLEGEDKRREALFKGLNKIQPDRRVSPGHPEHSYHWYKADMDAETLQKLQDLMRGLDS